MCHSVDYGKVEFVFCSVSCGDKIVLILTFQNSAVILAHVSFVRQSEYVFVEHQSSAVFRNHDTCFGAIAKGHVERIAFGIKPHKIEDLLQFGIIQTVH